MSGLTVGYLSIDEMVLEIKVIGGTDEEKSQGLIVQDVLHDKHRLLVTLLLSNAFAMEALPIFINRLLPEWAAIIISTTLVLFLGEVIPQAYATGPNQMKVACMCANLTKNLMWVLYPLNYPLGLMLDSILGKHSRNRLINSDLRTLIELHTYSSLKKHELIHDATEEKTNKPDKINSTGNSNYNQTNNKSKKPIELQPIQDTVNSIDEYNSQINTLKEDKLSYIKGNELSSADYVKKDLGLNDEQANLMVSAIEMKDKNAIELMIPINLTFVTSYDEKIDNIRLSVILEKGYSRIPVYAGSDSNNIIGLVRIKQLIGIDFTNNKSMRQHGIQLKKPLCISPRTSLLELLREFRKGKSHMAFISESPKELSRKLDITCGITKGDVKDIKSNTQVLGIVTIEDVIEKMINSEIYDEDDYDDMKKDNKLAGKSKFIVY